MNSLARSTKNQIFLLKLLSFWDCPISNRNSINFLYFLYKNFNISLYIYIIYKIGISIANFNTKIEGLEIYFKHFMVLLSNFSTIFCISEGFFGRDEWNIILLEFEAIEINLKLQKLSSMKQIFILTPMLIFMGNIFLNWNFDLHSAIKIYVSHITYFSNFLMSVWFVLYCWNIKNQYRNLISYLNKIQKLIKVKKTEDFSPQILWYLQLFNQLSGINLRAKKFFMLKISTIMGNMKA